MAHAIVNAARRIGKGALLLLYPNKCFMCESLLTGDDWLCGGCEIPVTYPWQLCPHCGKCECICDRFPGRGLDGVCAPMYYSEQAIHGIHRFKYRGVTCLTPFLCGLMESCVRETFSSAQFDIVTFVPMTRKKQRMRGYFPARLLAKDIAKRFDAPLFDSLLMHTGAGGTQMKMAGDKRWENACKNFAIHQNASRIDNKRVLIVDDVLTTGSTMRRCAQLLFSLGAASVHGVAIATTASEEFSAPL